MAASAAFEAAYALDASQPAVLYAWAQSERLGGRCPHAVELYTKFRAAKISPAQDDAARDAIAQCAQADPQPPVTPPPAAAPAAPATGFTLQLRTPDDEITLGGAVLATLSIVLYGHGGDAVTEEAAARTASLMSYEANRAKRDHWLGGIGIAAGVAAVGVGIYLRVSHHDVEASTDGHVVSVGARF